MTDEKYLAYQSHKASAQARGIEFTLSFDEWCEVWGDKFALRGRQKGQLNMCRARDEGGYTLGNVRIATIKENMQESSVVKRVKAAQRPTSVHRGYRARVDDGAGWLRRDPFAPYSEEQDDEDAL